MKKRPKLQQEEEDERTENRVQGPNLMHGPGGRPGPPGFSTGRAKLEHPRNVLWHWIFSYIGKHKAQWIFYAALIIAGTFAMTFTSLISRQIIDKGIGEKNVRLIEILALIYITISVSMAFVNYIGMYGMGRIGQHIIYNVRSDLIGKLQGMSMAYFDKKLSGDIISITTNDVDQLNNLVGGQLVQIIRGLIAIVLIFTVMFIMNPLLALVSTIVFPVYLVAMTIFKRVTAGVFKDMRKKMSAVTSSIQENVAGAKVVQAFGQEKKAASEFDRVNQENYEAGFRMRKIISTFFPLIGFMSQFLVAVVLFTGGAARINNVVLFGEPVTAGALTVFIGLLSQFFEPFMTLMNFQQIIEAAMAASDRIYGLLDEEAELRDPVNPRPLPATTDIAFSGVSFGYRFNQNGNKGGKNGKPSGPVPTPVTSGPKPMGRSFPPIMMERIREYMSKLPEPYKTFLMENMGCIPQGIRRDLMPALVGRPPEQAASTIDDVFARHGFAVAGTKHAAEHPELKTTFDGAPAGLRQGMPGMEPMAMPRDVVLQMAKNLAKLIDPKAGMASSQGMGGEGGGMGGGMRGGGGSPKVILKMLASMPIPQDVLDELPDVVKNAITEERILQEREANVGFVLKGVDAKIPAGNTVAIVGETGAGKTTFIKLVSRFYDVIEGSVRIGGVDVRDLKKDELRRAIGMVPQDSYLFAGTIRENILYGIKNVTPDTDERMIEVTKFLGLHNFIEKLPEGYETVLKENASNISIGQRQLIAFARALMTNPPILILDEATSSVDPYTESLIQDALDKAREGRTTIIIAHRLSTIKNADWIFVLDKDKKGIIEQGTHDDLIKLGGKYKKLLDMQRKDIDQSVA
nr:ABC transporter transmembrane domain-containing protein [Candidatus Sigynarchaeum springense]